MSPEPAIRSRLRSDAVHAELLWAATKMFSRHGRYGASTREIAAAAGTTERTLFKHFGSKEGLLRAVVDEAVLTHLAPASLQDLQQAIEAYEGNFEAWHEQLLRSRLEALRQSPELTRLLVLELLGDELLRERFVEQWKMAVWRPLLALFTQLQSVGTLRRDLEVSALAAQFLRTNMGFLASQLLAAPGDADAEQAQLRALAALFSTGAVTAAS